MICLANLEFGFRSQFIADPVDICVGPSANDSKPQRRGGFCPNFGDFRDERLDTNIKPPTDTNALTFHV